MFAGTRARAELRREVAGKTSRCVARGACLIRRNGVCSAPGKRQNSGDRKREPSPVGHSARRRPFGLRLGGRQRLAHPLCQLQRHVAARKPRHRLPRLYLQGADHLHFHSGPDRRNLGADEADQARRHALRRTPRRGVRHLLHGGESRQQARHQGRGGHAVHGVRRFEPAGLRRWSYLLVLQANGLIKHHTVSNTMSKENLAKGVATLNPVKYWPHWTAVLTETKTGQKYAVESWLFANGENPAVVKVEDWYIKDRDL